MNTLFIGTEKSNQLKYLVVKNFKSMIRDKAQLVWLLGYPLLFVVLLTFAYGPEVLTIMAPGLLITGPVVIISQLTAHLAEEKESGTLQRLTTTPVTRKIILISGLVSQAIVGAFQIVILLIVGYFLGINYHPDGNLFFLFFIPFMVTITSLGFGLILASFIKNASSAGGLAWFVILPLQFLGGAFMDEPLVELLPTSLAVEAMREVMTFGNSSIAAIGLPLLSIALWGIGGIALGILLFQRKAAIL